MATNVSSWEALVSPNAEGAIPSVIDKYVVITLRDFCERSRIWKTVLTAINIVSGTSAYALTYATADICDVYHARVNGDDIYPTTQEYLDLYDSEWRDETSNYPEYYYVTPDKNINLVYTPSLAITSGLLVYVTLKPKTSDTTVEDFLYNEWSEVIANGAIAKLLRIGGSNYENKPLSDYFEQKYEHGIAKAKIKAVRGLSTRSSLKGQNHYI